MSERGFAPVRHHMNSRTFLLSSLLLLTLMCSATARDINRIEIYNKGTIDIWVAKLEHRTPFFSVNWSVGGWYKIAPGSYGGILDNSSDGMIHVVFALYTPDKRFGIIKYDFEGESAGRLPSWFVKKELCVKWDDLTASGSGLDSLSKHLPPCPAGYIAAPTSISAWFQGGVRGGYYVKPTENDYKRIAVFMERSKR